MNINEWKDMQNEYPEMPQDIKDMIQREVDAQINKKSSLFNKKEQVENNKKIFRYAKVAGFTLAAVLAVGGTSYAATKIFKINIEKNGNYGADISVSTETGTSTESEEVIVPEIALELKNLPDGYVTMEGYQDFDADGNVSNCSKIIITKENYDMSEANAGLYVYSLPEGYENFNVHDKYVTATDEIELTDGFASYIEIDKNAGIWDVTSKIYAIYPELNHMVEIAGFNDISKEDMIAIANAIDITNASEKDDKYYVEADQLLPGDEPVYTYTDEVVANNSDNNSQDDYYSKYGVVNKTEFESNLHQIGEEVRFSYKIENFLQEVVSEDGDFGVKITDVKVCDNVDEAVMHKYCEALDNNIGADGKLIPENIQYIKYGDGIDTKNEVVKTETKNMKFVLVTMEYTNYSGGNNLSFCFSPGYLIRAKEDGGNLVAYSNKSKIEDGIDDVVGEFYSDNGSAAYWYNGVDGNQNNNIENFCEGETRTVYSGFFVAEDELSDMYLEIFNVKEDNRVFGYFTIEENGEKKVISPALECGFFDIRQK